MQDNDLSSWQGFRRWFDELDDFVAAVVAQRCAMRLLPFWLLEYLKGEVDGTAEIGFQTLRNLMSHQTLLMESRDDLLNATRSSEAAANARSFMTHEVTDHGTRHAQQAATILVDERFFPGRKDGFWWQIDYACRYIGNLYDAPGPLFDECRRDAEMIAKGTSALATPLWADGAVPDLFDRASRGLINTLRDDLSSWTFWLRWWEGILSGQQIDWALQNDVALIPNEVWDSGPDAVAEAIAVLEAQWRQKHRASQAEFLLQAAMADFTFDAFDRVMRMVPFEEDIRHLRDPDRLRSFLDDAAATRDDLELFKSALAAEGALQGAGAVRTYLDGVLSEIDRAEDLTHLRVGRLIEMGKILESYSLNPDVANEFGPLIAPLKSHVRGLLDLTRRHFAATLTRMAPLHDLTSGPDDDQWALLQDIQRGILGLTSPRGTGLPPLANDDQSALLSVAQSIERLLREHDVVPTPNAKSSLRREIDYGLALLSVSVALFIERAKATKLTPGTAVDNVLTPYKRATGLSGLWQLIKKGLDIP